MDRACAEFDTKVAGAISSRKDPVLAPNGQLPGDHKRVGGKDAVSTDKEGAESAQSSFGLVKTQDWRVKRQDSIGHGRGRITASAAISQSGCDLMMLCSYNARGRAATCDAG